MKKRRLTRRTTEETKANRAISEAPDTRFREGLRGLRTDGHTHWQRSVGASEKEENEEKEGKIKKAENEDDKEEEKEWKEVDEGGRENGQKRKQKEEDKEGEGHKHKMRTRRERAAPIFS